MSYFYKEDVGKTVEIIREPPCKEYDVCVGDIGIITYVANTTNKCSVYIPNKNNPHEYKDLKYGNPGDFWIPFECLKEYCFKNGDRVIIVTDKSKNKGKIGTVINNNIGYKHHVGILLDDYEHRENTQYDTKLCRTSIRLIDCNEIEKMEVRNMKLTGFNKVAVIEIGNTEYHFALYDDNIQIGDWVLVTGSSNARLLMIKEIISKDEAKERFNKDITAEVICKVDLSAYDTRVENRKKAEKLRKEMDKKIAEMDEMNKYVLYAEKNKDLAKMLAEYRELV